MFANVVFAAISANSISKKSNLGPCGCTVAPEETAFTPGLLYPVASKRNTG